MNVIPPMLNVASFVSIACALYLQFKGLGSLVMAVDRRQQENLTPAERRTLVAGTVGYLCLSVFFGVMGVGEFVRVATEKVT